MLDPESEQIREVYAFFGLAMYLAQNLERALAILLAVSGEAKPMTAWDYDARLAENFQSTFGALVSRFVELAGSDHVTLSTQLEKAVVDRNDLAHHYFWERSIPFCSKDGRAEMITELQQMGSRFETLDDALTELARERVTQRGVSIEDLETHVATHMDELLAGTVEPYNPERVPKSIEIVAAYEWRTESTVKSKLVLGSGDGRYLILGEKGLCYGPRDVALEELVVKQSFEKALPATVNPRPKISVPWNYAIILAHGYLLRVRLDELDGEAVVRFGLHKPRAKRARI